MRQLKNNMECPEIKVAKVNHVLSKISMAIRNNRKRGRFGHINVIVTILCMHDTDRNE